MLPGYPVGCPSPATGQFRKQISSPRRWPRTLACGTRKTLWHLGMDYTFIHLLRYGCATYMVPGPLFVFRPTLMTQQRQLLDPSSEASPAARRRGLERAPRPPADPLPMVAVTLGGWWGSGWVRGTGSGRGQGRLAAAVAACSDILPGGWKAELQRRSLGASPSHPPAAFAKQAPPLLVARVERKSQPPQGNTAR